MFIHVKEGSLQASRLFTFGLMLLATFAIATPYANAAADPAGCTDNGGGISLAVFRSDGITNIGFGSVQDGELVKYQATLSALSFPNCAYEGGTWTLMTPNGTVHPLGSVPQIGGSGVASFASALISYTVDHSNEIGAYVTAISNYGGGFSHGSTEDTTPGPSLAASKQNGVDHTVTLHLRKVITNDNGGTATLANFTLTADGAGANDISGVSPVDSSVLQPGTFALSETSMPGYTASAWVCTGGSQDGASITLTANQEATCTITNNDIAPSLTLNKITSYSNGGSAPESSWTLTANGGDAGTLSGAGAAGSTDVVSGTTFKAGTYTLSESAAPTGYTNGTSYSCVKNGGGSVSGNSITLALGDVAVCSITNTDQAGHLIVHKVTNPANNTTVFSVTLDSAPTSGSATQDLSTVSNVDYSVSAGTYAVSEASVSGWDETSNTCVDVVVAVGATENCTITNTMRGHIIIKKNAINDSDQAFTFNNNFENDNPSTFQLVDDAQVGLPSYDAEVLPGEYAVSEDPVAGWKSSSATCDLGQTIGSITVGAGETVTCTFTNTELATIELVKHTVTGDGTFNFTMTGETLDSSAQLVTEAGVASKTFINIDPDNTYSITETPIPEGWANTSASCDNGDPVTAITPNAGEVIVCTFTNGKLPTLTLVKTVVNDNSGSAVANDFQAKIDGENVAWGDTQTLAVGDYTASETTLPGYVASDWGTDCAADGSVSLAYGDEKVCTITNNDVLVYGHLVVQKTTNPGADLTVFSITASGTGDITGGGGGTVTDAIDKHYEVTAGTYSVTEAPLVGWNETSNTCVEVVVVPGETVYCTITNTKLAPSIQIEKNPSLQNIESGGTANFTITVTNTGNTALVNVTVTDPLSPDCNKVIGDMLSGAVEVYSCEKTSVTENFTNVATVVGTPPFGDVVTDEDDADVTVFIPIDERRMTGGGSVFREDKTRITHGFELHCDISALPNRLEVNWPGTGKGKKAENNFHLEELTSAVCSYDSELDAEQPNDTWNTYEGTGIGKLNGVDGATASWTFTDDGEPGKTDMMTITIKNALDEIMLEVSGLIRNGNQQAH